ncbi:DUF2569 domain-containing protein [Vallitalea okinawensis]|uniref:DUF2569 domain-containing protein n=1 Tax=Vallitalea okinawensis TaxID=2078660 RepID=UPI000CFE1D64|nr:DUF2569 domain-containing protein [Vallitalea okinawensis]
MEFENINDDLSGIKGWLIVAAIGVILRPITLLISLIGSISFIGSDSGRALTTVGAEFYHPLWEPSLYFELITSILFFIVSLFLIYFFFKKKARFPKMIIIYFVSYGLTLIIITILLSIIMPYDISSNWGETIVNLIPIIIWCIYFFKSERVRNTFIN